jgi:calcium-binding protein CML
MDRDDWNHGLRSTIAAYNHVRRLIDDDDDPAINDEDGEILEAFRIFDKDGDGLISAPDLLSTLSRLGLLSASASFPHVQAMIARFDSDLDGFVSFSDFKSMIKL